ncbi:MAG: restriction endonuclease subunit S [Planctomycetaceae bacterium]
MSKAWPMVPLGEVLQLQRRWIKLHPTETYREIGIRSFGKGIFHKAPIAGITLGNKRVLRIEPGDLVFNNVFAWEGAVAVAGPEETGMIGSHRFVTYTVNPTKSTAEFLKLFFATPGGLAISRMFPKGTVAIPITGATIGVTRILGFDSCFPDSIVGIQAEPDQATPEFIYLAVEHAKKTALAEATQTTQPNINLGNLQRLKVRVPPLAEQRRIVAELDTLQAEVDALKRLQAETAAELDALLPAILDLAFKGEL